jgi:glutaredoxin
MAQRRKIEVFTAGCPCCIEAVELVELLAGTEHDIEIRDMHDPDVAVGASGYGIRRVPAIVIDGQLVDYVAGFGPNEATLTQALFG